MTDGKTKVLVADLNGYEAGAFITKCKKRRNNSGLQRGQEFQAAASGASQQQHEAIPYSQQGSTIFDIDASRLLG